MNHTFGIVDVRTRADTNTIDSTWRHVKAFFSDSKRMEEYVYHLAHYTLAARCRSENVEHFMKLIDNVASIYWRETPNLLQSAATTLHLQSYS